MQAPGTPLPRVCFVVESGTDVRLIDGLAAQAELTVLARRIDGGVEISRTPRDGVTVDVGPPSFAAFARRVFSYLRARRTDFDFVLVQGYGAAAAAANAAARLTGIETAMLVCSPTEAYYRCRRGQSGFGKPFRARELFALRAAAALNARIGMRYIVLSRHLAQVVASHGTSAPVEVIPVYGVDTAVFAPPAADRGALRRQRGLPAAGEIVFFSSRIAPEKDAATLLRAVALLRARGRDIHILHRSGGFRRFMEDAAAYGIADRVIATDAVHPVHELPLDYGATDLCVQASRAEGLGFSVLEALACGVPVVAARVGGLAETIIDGVTGWTYSPGSADELAAAMAGALDNPVAAAATASAGRRLVQAQYERALVFERLAACIDARVARA